MIITTEKGTIKSNLENTLLTDGMSYGWEYNLGKARNINEFSEISLKDYEKTLEPFLEENF